jgi:hypothetical protein
MKTTQIFALSLGFFLIAICGISDAGEKKFVNVEVPLPDDITVVAPVGDIPKGISAFSGVWEGKWTYTGADSALIVEKINPKEAKVILSLGESQLPYKIPARYVRYKAIVIPDNQQIKFYQSEDNIYIFTMENTLNQIRGTKKTPVGGSDIIMTKVK